MGFLSRTDRAEIQKMFDSLERDVKMAIDNPHITADVIEVTEFLPLAERYAVRGVPKTVINEGREFVGALPEAEFVRVLVDAVSPPAES